MIITDDETIINLYYSLKEDGVPVEIITEIIAELKGSIEDEEQLNCKGILDN